MPELMTTKQAAEFLHMSLSHLYKLKTEKKIPCHQISEKMLLFSRDELMQWVLSDGKDKGEQTK